jgi:CelD/BcsL family acetyltransferase involved in cellulose biosynthesis
MPCTMLEDMYPWTADKSLDLSNISARNELTCACGLHVEKITEIPKLEALVPEWRALDATLSPRLPFTSPEWSLLWWQHFRRNRLTARDQLNTYVVRDRARALVAVAPMMISSRPATGPFRLRELQFLGADTNVTELRGVVCHCGDLPDVVAALRQALTADRANWDWVQWRGLQTGAGIPEWRHHLPGLRTTGTVSNYYLPLAESWAEFKTQLPRNVKESLRKCYNSLTRDGHSFTVEAVAAPEAIPAAIDQFLALHAQRASLTGTVSHINCFVSAQARAFLHEHAASQARNGAIRVFQLNIGGTVVATRIAFLLGQEMYLYYSGYDPAWKQYSVMTTLLAEMFKWGIAHGFHLANLSIGQDVSKTRWRPEVAQFAEGFEVAPTLRSAIAFEVMDRLRRAVKGRVSQASKAAHA